MTDFKPGNALSDYLWQPSNPAISLRKIKEDDKAVLIRIYRSTREEELNQTPWSEEQKVWFIQNQFEAQHYHYQTYYAHADFWILMYNESVAGRLYVDLSDQLRIIDIALLPEFRNQGIGASLFKDLQHYARAENLPVSIHVEQYNPAKNLYKRLGFVEKETVNSIYILMEWKPNSEKNG